MRFLVYSLLLAAMIGTASGDSWHIDIIDTGTPGLLTENSSLELDSNDRSRIAYCMDKHYVKYAYQTPSLDWAISTVYTRDYCDNSSMDLMPDGTPAISWHCWYGPNVLKYAELVGSSWSVQTVDSGGSAGYHSSLAVSPGYTPYIAYYDHDGTNGHLQLAHRQGGSVWLFDQANIAGDVGQYTDIAFDSYDLPHISCYHVTEEGMIEAFKHIGGYWSVYWVDYTGGDTGHWTSIAIDSDGHHHISYHDVANGSLKYAYYNGSSWSIVTVDDQSSCTGYCTSIAVDSNNHPHIAYHSPSSGGLRYASSDGSSWTTEIVDPSWMAGWYASLQIDGDDNPRIAYCCDENLMYAWYGPDSGIEEDLSAVLCEAALSLFPSPFTAEMTVSFSLTAQAPVSLYAVDLSGRVVDVIQEGVLPAGDHSAIWRPNGDVASGCYLVVLDAGNVRMTQRCVKI